MPRTHVPRTSRSKRPRARPRPRKPAGRARRRASVVAAARVPLETIRHGRTFLAARRRLAAAAGGEMIGCSLYRVPPGKRPFPYHFHTANEEALFILEGRGTLRLGGRRIPIGRGDYVALPVGPRHAHQVVNTSRRPLVYLCISTMIHPEISHYPDTGKVGLIMGSPPGRPNAEQSVEWLPKTRTKVGYWAGED
jgi:uncharacterized cupin superfamily protein